MTEDLRYPIGHLVLPEPITRDHVSAAIETLAETPKLLREAVEPMTPEQLNTPYRDGGWTVQQLVHHIADSHANASIRIRLGLTEDWPTIKAYDEKAWSELGDADAPVEWSLRIIENTHARWVLLLRSLDEAQWKRGFVHPERGRSNLKQATLLYQWHAKHHLAHVVNLRQRMGW